MVSSTQCYSCCFNNIREVAEDVLMIASSSFATELNTFLKSLVRKGSRS